MGGWGGRGSTQGFGPVPFTRTFLCQDCSNQFRDLRLQSVLDYPPPATGTTSTSWAVHGTIHCFMVVLKNTVGPVEWWGHTTTQAEGLEGVTGPGDIAPTAVGGWPGPHGKRP